MHQERQDGKESSVDGGTKNEAFKVGIRIRTVIAHRLFSNEVNNQQ